MTRSAPDFVPEPGAQGVLSHWLHSPFLHEHGLGYAFSVAATGLASALSFMLAALENEPVRYLLFVPAILISAAAEGSGLGFSQPINGLCLQRACTLRSGPLMAQFIA